LQLLRLVLLLLLLLGLVMLVVVWHGHVRQADLQGSRTSTTRNPTFTFGPSSLGPEHL
jgi:hypothetical protein